MAFALLQAFPTFPNKDLQQGAHQGPLTSLLLVEYFTSDDCVSSSFFVETGRELIVPFSFSRESLRPSL